MEILYILIPVSLILLGIAIWAFFWAARSGQFDDLESPAYRVLMEEEGEDRERSGQRAGREDRRYGRD